jgi:hypothetical protein
VPAVRFAERSPETRGRRVVIEEFERQFHSRLLNFSGEPVRLRNQRDQLEVELRRLTDAVAQAAGSSFLLLAIREREREVREITDRLPSDRPESVDLEWQEMRSFVVERLHDIRAVLTKDIPRARDELARHVREIRIQPHRIGSDRFSVAEREWCPLREDLENWANALRLARSVGCGGWI